MSVRRPLCLNPFSVNSFHRQMATFSFMVLLKCIEKKKKKLLTDKLTSQQMYINYLQYTTLAYFIYISFSRVFSNVIEWCKEGFAVCKFTANHRLS